MQPSEQQQQRPPRARPGRSEAPTSPQYEHQGPPPQRPQMQYNDGTRQNVSFQEPQRDMTRSPPPHNMSSAYQNHQVAQDPETGEYLDSSRVGRKKSLVRPEREHIEPGHRQWHYRSHVAQMEDDRVGPSTTGNYPQREALRRGKSLLAREEDQHESGLSLFKRSATLRRKRPQSTVPPAPAPPPPPKKGRRCLGDTPGPGGPWMSYCFFLTFWIPRFMMRACGLHSPEQQRAWREKMGLVSLITFLMAGVGYITFGFTESVCATPKARFHSGEIGNGSVIIHGYNYNFSSFQHPAANGLEAGWNPLLDGGFDVAGNDASFLFQKVNENCLGVLRKASGSTITGNGDKMDWYFPCNVYSQRGNSAVNVTNYERNTMCHTSSTARSQLGQMKVEGQVYLTWGDIRRPDRNLAVYESSVLDLDLLKWLSGSQVSYPPFFDELSKANGTYNAKDLTMYFQRTKQRDLGYCLKDLVTVGFIDTNTIGCVASEVVLYVSLIFIIGVVGIRFLMAVMFQWFFSRKLGNFPKETYEQRMQRSAEIENWTNDIYKPAPSELRPNVNKNGLRPVNKAGGKKFLKQSRFTPSDHLIKPGARPTTAYGMLDSSSSVYTNNKRATYASRGGKGTPPDTPNQRGSRSTASFPDLTRSSFAENNPCPFPLYNVVPQPPPEYEPFNFPLAHTICLVTAYSESIEGLRTTLDSLAQTDYPNSHKVILIIADGMVKGSGNDMTTPDICLTMMKELVVEANDVEPHSYVAIADGHKRHNMAKVYAGFYDYDDATTERSKQQRVPIVLVAKCGNPLEARDAKPGNRGKRDSQIMLMAFLQKVMFDERMTTFEYEFFNSLWRVTGVSPDRYELVLCVDADTKAFPDALTRMVACMVHDEDIMGLCGETKIANKAETFVTMMQVFEYYISHHMTKAFESMFGGVTCLPGCFSMYRIKAPKGDLGFWVPILANPDIVEHYSENVVDTLHKKNLLLLGEDRYLTTLLLKTFPKRKNVFCPQAVCKTVVPDTFSILLSQRRRWINSTIHNLFELVLVRDLCGTFCFSMQFVVAMELAGTLVLPAAIAFTIYLIIVSIIPGGTDTTIPLILLAIVLGLPGILIVVTSRKLVYIGWMLVYLISLPIWNGILPMYSFWHFDDFSWGETRKIEGVVEGGDHGDKDGEFDSSNIVMKKWAEFERDRRWKSGTQSRDSLYRDKRADSNRYSLTTDSDNHQANSVGFDSSTAESAQSYMAPNPRPRYDSKTLVMLPAPLSVARAPGSSSSGGPSRSSEGTHSDAHQRLVSPQIDSPYSETPYSPYTSPIQSPSPNPRYQTSSQDAYIPSRGQTTPARSATQQYSGESQNPFRGGSGYDDYIPYTSEPEETTSPVRGGGGGRGVRLTDGGPVAGPDGGVRRVARPTKRPTSQAPTQNRYSRGSLPPGAAPPSH